MTLMSRPAAIAATAALAGSSLLGLATTAHATAPARTDTGVIVTEELGGQ